MKYCDEMESLLSVYFDGECTPEETAQIRAHLKTCAACRQRLREYALARENFPDDFDVSVPADLSANVMAAIRAGRAPQQKRRGCVWKKILLPLAACLVIALALPNFSSHFLENQRSATAAPAQAAASGTKVMKQKKETTAISSVKGTPAKSKEKTLSSQKSSVADSAAPDDGASSADAASKSQEAGEAANTYGANRTAVSAPYHKWISITADAAGSLLNSFDGTADADPVSGQSATRYEMSAEQFAAIAEQIDGVSVHTNAGTESALCCVYVLSSH